MPLYSNIYVFISYENILIVVTDRGVERTVFREHAWRPECGLLLLPSVPESGASWDVPSVLVLAGQ